MISAVPGAIALDDRNDAVEAEPGVDGRVGELRPRPVGLLVELHEDEVPELLPAVATTLVLGRARRPAARAGATPVVVDLAVVAARARRAGSPPVLSETRDALRGDADLLDPEPLGIHVVGVDARPESLGVEAEDVRGEIPRVVDRPFLEVVTDRPVAEHLEKRVMGWIADRGDVVVFQSRAAKAFLTRDEVRRRWRALSGDPRFERHHAGHGEEKRRIVVGNERETREPVMPALLEEAKKSLPDLSAAHGEINVTASRRILHGRLGTELLA